MSTKEISQAALTQATKQAEATGVPQPVKDGGGHLVYYVDGTGAVVPRAIAEDRIQHAAAAKVQTPSGELVKGGGGLRAESPKDVAAAIAADQAAQDRALKLNGLNIAAGNAWVNGQRMTVAGMAPDGTPIYTYENSLKKDPKTGLGTLNPQKNTAFSALNGLGANTSADAMWTSSVGATDIFTGEAPNPNNPKLGDHGSEANTVQGRTMMTVGQGVQWFLDLSVQHPDVYQHLLDQLKAANYLNPKTPGGYGNDAAVAAATAMSDLAQINSTSGGHDLDLPTFLANKAKDMAKLARASVQPVNRAYQDPATLSASARTAAEAAIGRALTPAEEQAFEASFRSKENAAYSQIDASNQNQAAAAATGGSAPGAGYSLPDTSGQADALMNSPQFAQEKAGYSALEYTKALQTFLSGGTL